MQRTPCEYMLWNGIPTIRKELAETLIKEYKLSQREAAEKLGLTPAAICQYLSKKRGKEDIFDKKIIQEITISAERIMKNNGGTVVVETCRICRLVQKNIQSTLKTNGQQKEKE
ncbi:MAG: transcriptional regulator [Candidatus Thermoplasmatota archaeon]|nr:transcriptional regulator [Candidatus Thermoplasmatota archaeon]